MFKRPRDEWLGRGAGERYTVLENGEVLAASSQFCSNHVVHDVN